jgi:hypothetical protein
MKWPRYPVLLALLAVSIISMPIASDAQERKGRQVSRVAEVSVETLERFTGIVAVLTRRWAKSDLWFRGHDRVAHTLIPGSRLGMNN